MKKQMIFACATFASVNGLFALTVTDVTARQRWPWNGLVDVDFTITGAAAGEKNYILSTISLGVTLIITLAGICYYRRLCKQEQEETV